MWTNTSGMGRVRETVVGDINGGCVDLGHDDFTPAVDAVVKPNALIVGEVAKGGKIALVWGSDAPKELMCTALGCVFTSKGHELLAIEVARR